MNLQTIERSTINLVESFSILPTFSLVAFQSEFDSAKKQVSVVHTNTKKHQMKFVSLLSVLVAFRSVFHFMMKYICGRPLTSCIHSLCKK